jgi:hypothetical protein
MSGKKGMKRSKNGHAKTGPKGGQTTVLVTGLGLKALKALRKAGGKGWKASPTVAALLVREAKRLRLGVR